MARKVGPPKKTEAESKIFATNKRQWEKACEAYPAAMNKAYRELCENPFPPGQLRRHHRLKGRLKEFWEYEATGGLRVRYKQGVNDEVVIVFVGTAPADTH